MVQGKEFQDEEACMDRKEFEAGLKQDGYTQIEQKSLPPRPRNDEHGHPYAVRGLVLSGAFTVTQRDVTKTYCAGEIFAVAAGQDHAEEIGPEGAEVVVGRKY
jgi:quercetin dioxygenase-like cupin family protein